MKQTAVLLLSIAIAVRLPCEMRAAPNAWPAASDIISRAEVFKPEAAGAISGLQIAGIHWGGAIYPGEEGSSKDEQTRERIRTVHARGARYIGSINGRGLYFKDMDTEAVRLLNGKPYVHTGMNNLAYKCSLSPRVNEALLTTARGCVDRGMDGFILDSWQGEGRKLCFCHYCLQFYRERLTARAGSQELGELKDTDFSDFDYAEYLRSKGYTADTPQSKLPLGQMLSDERYLELVKRKRQFFSAAKAYAAAHARKPFTVTANVYDMPAACFAITVLLDYVQVELPYFGSFNGYPPIGSSIALHKKGAATGKRCVVQMGSHDTAQALVHSSSIAGLLKIWIAEAYACGNIFDLTPREFAGFEDGKQIFLRLPVSDLAPYYRFVQSHPEIYADADSPAQVAVLYSRSASAASVGPYEQEYQAVCKLLYDSHYQFDVLLDGEGKWSQTTPLAQALSKYETLIVPCPQALTEETVRQLLICHEKGTKIVLCGKQSRAAKPYRRLCEAVEGSFIEPQDLPSYADYLSTRDPDARIRFAKAAGGDPFLSTDAPADLGVICRRIGQQTIVHLINYGYSKKTDSTRPTPGIELTLATGALSATLLSPDTNGSINLSLKPTGDRVRVAVPAVGAYSVVVLSNKLRMTGANSR